MTEPESMFEECYRIAKEELGMTDKEFLDIAIPILLREPEPLSGLTRYVGFANQVMPYPSPVVKVVPC